MGYTDLESGTRVCTRCEEEKPLDAFHRNKRDVAGRQHVCPPCHSESRRERHAANPQYYKDVELRHYYGISYEIYEQMLVDQEGVCAICRNPETATTSGVIRMLSVDHDHETGRVRGLLCQKCNSVLGLAMDDSQLLERAIAYLVTVGDRS